MIKSRRLGSTEYVARIGKRRGAHSVLVGKPEGIRRLGINRRRWENNIKMDLEEVGCDMDWIDLRSVAGCCECGNEPSSSGKCKEILDQLRNSWFLKDSVPWS
jgi:hypothetical protein